MIVTDIYSRREARVKAIIITIGFFLIVFGLASFAYNNIAFTNPQLAQTDSFQFIYQKLNILAISPKMSSILMGVGVVLVVLGFSSKS